MVLKVLISACLDVCEKVGLKSLLLVGVFFTINTLTFSGQQGGLVNLRLRMTTYLRSSGDLPPATGEEPVHANDQALLHPQEVR